MCIRDRSDSIYEYIALSTGTGKADEEKIKAIIEKHPKIQFLCIDVANGYSEYFVEFVQRARKNFPDKTIIAGNVVTGEMVEAVSYTHLDVYKRQIKYLFEASIISK